MNSKRTALACIMALITVVAALLAVPAVQTMPLQAATTTAYGAGAYTGSNPIGGGDGYVSPHGYSQAAADYVVTTLAQLNSAMASASSGDVIWIPNGTTIVVPSVASAGTRNILPNMLGSGVVLASNRGQNGAAGGKIKVTGTTSSAFQTGIRVQSKAVISGLTIEGPTNRGFSGTTSCYTMCALNLSGCYGVEIENCELYNFPESIISISNIHSGGVDTAWNSSNRHNIHHSYIHGAQAHGWGYGILQHNSRGKSLAALVDACIIEDCRHEIACDHGTLANYEMRYCIVGDAWYYYTNNGKVYYSAPVDAHGGGTNASICAGEHYEIHHNTFSSNPGKPTAGIRGIPDDCANFYNNWTKKTIHSGLYPSGGGNETGFSASGFVALCGSEGGSWSGSSNLTSYGVYVRNNWYGTSAPSSGTDTDTGANQAPVLAAIGSKSVVLGQSLTFTVSASDADGDALTYSTSNLPSGATFTPSSRTFTWTPASGQGGSYAGVLFKVSDGALADSESVTITVTTTSTNTTSSAPVLLSPANGARVSGTSVTFKWQARTGATKYFLVVSTSSSLTTTQSNSSVRKFWGEVSTTQKTVTGFANSGKTYYWWVYAGNSSGWSSQADVLAQGGWKLVNGS